ncbi:MAG TPA: DUF4149 domain-containing protein [Acidobacteriaceae bacterium]|jgi:hypothetical protein|nr:DUF4149 domain-containing protein [Acidobacteriaceae bacterium]
MAAAVKSALILRTAVRALLLFCLVVWLGGLLFFGAVVAPVAFGILMPMIPDPAFGLHVAGTMVRNSLLQLHWMGLIAGAAMIFLCAVERGMQWTRRSVVPYFVVLGVMLALTAFSQFSIIPRMETLRLQAGSAIDNPTSDNPARVEFNRLHNISTQLEGGVLVGGLVLVVLLARPEPQP